MKRVRPIGAIRLLAPILGRARRRWRGGPLAPMIWRRRPCAQPASAPQKPAAPLAIAHSHIVNLTLVWPAGIAARAAPLRQVERTLRERFSAGREPGRLVTLVERLWLHPGEAGSRAMAAPLPASTSQPAHRRQDAPGISRPRDGRTALDFVTASRDAETPVAKVLRVPAQPLRKPRPMRAGALRQGKAPPAAETRLSRAPAPTAWRVAAAPADSQPAASRLPSRPSAPLVWRKDEAGVESPVATRRQGHAERMPGAEIVWRRPPPAPARNGDGAAHDAAAYAPGRSDSYARAYRPSSPAYAAPSAPPQAAAIQPAEMSRLVDEVVRRLDRIGRDERMRRGI